MLFFWLKEDRERIGLLTEYFEWTCLQGRVIGKMSPNPSRRTEGESDY
jgi:hypothetical protein